MKSHQIINIEYVSIVKRQQVINIKNALNTNCLTISSTVENPPDS